MPVPRGLSPATVIEAAPPYVVVGELWRMLVSVAVVTLLRTADAVPGRLTAMVMRRAGMSTAEM